MVKSAPLDPEEDGSDACTLFSASSSSSIRSPPPSPLFDRAVFAQADSEHTPTDADTDADGDSASDAVFDWQRIRSERGWFKLDTARVWLREREALYTLADGTRLDCFYRTADFIVDLILSEEPYELDREDVWARFAEAQDDAPVPETLHEDPATVVLPRIQARVRRQLNQFWQTVNPLAGPLPTSRRALNPAHVQKSGLDRMQWTSKAAVAARCRFRTRSVDNDDDEEEEEVEGLFLTRRDVRLRLKAYRSRDERHRDQHWRRSRQLKRRAAAAAVPAPAPLRESVLRRRAKLAASGRSDTA